MSYCRWSSDCFRCDIYSYADVGGGYTIHVAARKRDVPLDWRDPLATLMDGIDPENTSDVHSRMAEYKKVQADIECLPFLDINTPSAGKSFNEPTLEAFKARLLLLRAEGLRFPDHVLLEIDEEMKADAVEPH